MKRYRVIILLSLITLFLATFTWFSIQERKVNNQLNQENKNLYENLENEAGNTEENTEDIRPHELPHYKSLQKKDKTEELVCEPVYVYRAEYSNIINKKPKNVQKNIGYQNNKVGIYIYAEIDEFTDKAEELVNSNGGDWGYVLIPYNVNDYNETKWNKLFDKLSEKHLIPIIQLWDIKLDDEDEVKEQIYKSANFLDSLKWPIKQRYVSVYNEPNDKKFWGGNVNPAEYAKILDETIKALKSKDENFFVMNGAFNASARTGGGYLDEETFLIRMNKAVPGIFRKLDGWASHPYPQPNFSGSPKATGRNSIRAYEWELQLLKRYFGIDTENLPVFITETGWAHKESEAHDNGKWVKYGLDKYTVADYFRYAYENVWLPDDRIVAVTPFTIRYDPPYDHFSWITQNNNNYPQFDAIKDMKKTEGLPEIIHYEKSKVLECKYKK